MVLSGVHSNSDFMAGPVHINRGLGALNSILISIWSNCSLVIIGLCTCVSYQVTLQLPCLCYLTPMCVLLYIKFPSLVFSPVLCDTMLSWKVHFCAIMVPIKSQWIKKKSPTIGIFLYVAQAVERVLAVAFGKKLCWLVRVPLSAYFFT